jgi:hypothetical protein
MIAFAASFIGAFYLDIEFMSKLIPLISLPIVLLFIFVNKILTMNIVSIDWELVINYVSLAMIVISILSAFTIISEIIFSKGTLPSLNYVYDFYIILSIFSPIYLILIAFCYPFIIILKTLRKKWNKTFPNRNQENITVERNPARLPIRFFHLSLVIILSIVVSMIPQLSTVNVDDQVIGSDTRHYMYFFIFMSESEGLGEILYQAFVSVMGGDRPLSILFFFLMSWELYQGSFYALLQDLPLLLSPLIVISTYFLTYTLTKNHLTSIVASIITISTHILVGIYAGLYANWFSLIWAYMVLLFLFRIVDKPKKFDFYIFSILLVAVLFSHVQTWTIFMYVIGLFLAVHFFQNKKGNKKTVLNIILSILPSLSIEIIRMVLINNSGITQEINFALFKEVGLHDITTIWHNLIGTTHLYWAGQIANPVVLLLVIYWLYGTKIREKYTIFFIIFFSLIILPLIFADAEIQSRFLYEIPFQIPAAVALTILRDRVGSLMPAAICLWLIVVSVYMASNFYLVVPERFLS